MTELVDKLSAYHSPEALTCYDNTPPAAVLQNVPKCVIYVVDTSNLCQISGAAVLLFTLLAEPRLKNAKVSLLVERKNFILVLSKMDAAYRQMRNEALLMLQFARLSTELGNAPELLEASPLTGEGIDKLRTFISM
ncbi:unnamed protein product [Arctia plantaginis]|uniref:Uncharacterized protein n=1 Tax=Arctia plantaginis TaxID=874455 RepID=A0A8S1BBY2_ARCPL|nr:unnamed protein product [Arctia plantaginis]